MSKPPKKKDPMPTRIDAAGELLDAVKAWYNTVSADDEEEAIDRLVGACKRYENEVGW